MEEKDIAYGTSNKKLEAALPQTTEKHRRDIETIQ
jgi:hypothetical protein